MWDQVLQEIADGVPKPEQTLINEDGLRLCAKCKTPVEARHWHPLKKTYVVLPIICECGKRAIAEADERLRQEAIEHNRDICFGKSSARFWTFNDDDGADQRISNAMKRYASKFDTMLAKGQGLLLYGTPGTGKTFYAACIANSVIDQGYTALMTDFGDIVARIQSSYDGRAEILNEVKRHSLLVLDDYGIERDTAYMDEIVYSIMNARLQSGKPLIVTTNLSLDREDDMRTQRLASRLSQMCFPVRIDGGDRRKAYARDTHTDIKDMLGL